MSKIAHYDIGLATPAEAAAIAGLSRDLVERGLQWSWTPGRVRARVLDRSTNVVVAREAGAVIGFALMEYADDRAHLVLLGVRPERRRMGVATALLRWLEETLAVAGIARIAAEVREANQVARAFYRSRGFEEFDLTPRYYQGRENAVHVCKELPGGAQ